ncbi:MAG: hypothetical protein LBP32_02560 [Spirochaetaceae bacterium]|jgi:chromosome segregation ATPase|nr:hypothetical protein [Spirochaetaceae bacterium]
MSFFTFGNLLTLGIVVLTLILYRQLDRNSRSIDKARRYGDRLKEDLAAFVAEKESSVKDYAIELDVQQKSAKELMKRVQMTDADLAGKAEAIAKIDERISAYDTSLEELVRMTGRVQENLNRIRDESAFVETTGKRVSEVKAKLESLEKELPELERRFERENAGSLERTAEAVVASVRSVVSDLEAAAEAAERRVEDHREAINKAEKARAANMDRDLALINKTLKAAVEQAAVRADKLEDAGLVKLREQALERVRRFQEAVEDKLRLYQENAKARVLEVQGLVKTYKETWRGENAEMEAKQRNYREEWKRDVQELNGLARTQREEWKRMSAETDAEVREMIQTLEDTAGDLRSKISAQLAETLEQAAAQTSAAEDRLQALAVHIDEAAAGMERRLEQRTEEADAKARHILSALETTAIETRERVSSETAALEQRLGDLGTHINDTVAKLEQRLAAHVEEAQQRALEAADLKLEEYRAAQTRQFQQLDRLADDVEKLDGVLRLNMRETENRVRRDFALFEQDSAAKRTEAAASYTASVDALKADLEGVEKELAALKERAYENVSAKLKVFEDDFAGDLSRRSDEIDKRLTEWRDELGIKLTGLEEESETARRGLERKYGEELKARLVEQSERLVSELEHLKAETGAFEEGIREQMSQADQSLQSFKEQLQRDLEDARSAAEGSAKAEIGRYALSMAETLKQNQRDIETAFREISDQVEARNGEITAILDGSRREIDEWQARFGSQLHDAETALEEARRRTRDMVAESDERIAAVRAAIEEVHREAAAHRAETFARTDDHVKALESAVKEADRHIKDFVNQTKLFDQADELKLQLERHIEDLRSDLDGLDQRRAEAAGLETQFVKIKRLGDEINAKMTLFLSEKRRIELMEADFKRIIQTSQSIEEKLARVTASDDTLQAVQVKIRQLDDAMTDTEEKYQRIERKNQTLEATNDGIDRNFKALQEAEESLKSFKTELLRFSGDQQGLSVSIGKLAAQCEMVQEASEKLSALDETLTAIEARIKDMQVARGWLARTETRLEEVTKSAQEQVKLMGTILKEESGKGAPRDRGAPPIGTREMVVKLAHQGWSVAEIARAVKISKGEVELILEIAPKD